MVKKAFTLIEVVISIIIFSIVMLFLYESYAALNISNTILEKESKHILDTEKLKKVIFLDFSLAHFNSVKIRNVDKKNDFVTLRGGKSLHQRFNPYVAYILKGKKLYRLESFKTYNDYNLDTLSEFDSDYLGKVESFRVYPSSSKDQASYLIHIGFIESEDIILKVKVLNEE